MRTAEQRAVDQPRAAETALAASPRLDGRPTCPTQSEKRPDFADFILLGTLAILLATATTGLVWALS